jgi:pilus assembly protein CpaE
MKIKVIAPQRARADELAKSIVGATPGAEILSAPSVAGGLLTAVNGSRPNLLVLEGVDASTLDALSQLQLTNPDVDAIIISDQQTPQFLMAAMKAGVREVLPSPVDNNALWAAVQRIARKRGAAQTPVKHGQVLAFMSCKGGNGSSFLAANLAHILAHRGEQTVGLLDFDLQFGDSLLMLTDQRATSDVAELSQHLARLDGSLLRASMVAVSPTLSVLPAPADLTRALEVKAPHVEAIIKQARQCFDFVVVDVSRSIDAVSLKVLDMADQIFPVLQLTLPNIRDAKRVRDLFRSLDYPAHKLHWVVNRYQKGGEITLESFEQALGAKDSFTVPNHHASVIDSVNRGIPIDTAARNNPIAKALHQLAQRIAPLEPARKERWLSSMFGGH